MRKLTVKTSSVYDVIIGENLIKDTANLLKERNLNGKVCVITDKNVDSLYSKTVIDSLLNGGYKVNKYVCEGGEDSKSGREYLNILEYLAENEFTRSDLLIALGGGVIGDLTGFVAATYLRGIDFVQIPTTILAFADSSVGGKTAINLNCGKNLAGAFYQPKLVICDVLTAKTLSDIDYSSGMAEVIKYGMVFDEELIKLLMYDADNLEEIIARSINWKREVVEEDERDNGRRQLLNFGHTLAHSIEKESNYQVAHGVAVAIGMFLITKTAIKNGCCDKNVLDVLEKVLKKYNLPTTTEIDIKTLFEKTLVDKKRKGENITVVIPEKVGKCKLQKMSISKWKNFILG